MAPLQVSWHCWPAWWCSQRSMQPLWGPGTPGWPSSSCCGPTQGCGTTDSPRSSPWRLRGSTPSLPPRQPSAHMVCPPGWWWRNLQLTTPEQRLLGCSTGAWRFLNQDLYWQHRPGLRGIANPAEDFMHHLTFAELVTLCVCECVCFYEGVGFRWAAQHLIVSLIGTVLLATACEKPTGSVTSVLASCQSWHNVDQLCHDMVKS